MGYKMLNLHLAITVVTNSGYRTATTAWYVRSDPCELLGKIRPHRWGPESPAASTVSVHSGMVNSSGAVAIKRVANAAATRPLHRSTRLRV